MLPHCTVVGAEDATVSNTDSYRAPGVPTGSGQERDDETGKQINNKMILPSDMCYEENMMS